MSIRSFTFSHRPRATRLAAALAVALGLTLSTAQGEPARAQARGQDRVASALELPADVRAKAAALHAAPRQAPDGRAPTPRAVTTCVDDINNPNSLRAQVAAAMSGDTIDLSTLLMVCSTITLGSEIAVPQDNLSFLGPGSAHLTIDGNAHSRIFKHTGAGMLAIYDLTIANGYYTSGNAASGGCISSTADVYLADSVITDCSAETTGYHQARGAGVYAEGNLQLGRSTITNSHAYAALGGAQGGGAYVVGEFDAIYSTISDNTAYDHSYYFDSHAGGVFAKGNVWIMASTISGNRAEYHGGMLLVGNLSATATITNSTISNNTSPWGVGGISTNVPLTLSHSTVAFNHSQTITGTGLYSMGATLTLTSSIIADNIGRSGESDLGGIPGTFVNGDHNLILVPLLLPVPGINIQSCPQLEPLADNGGYTRTHALHHTSVAIDQGGGSLLTFDQRGAPRVAGFFADIGAVEWQPGETDDRLFMSRFDGPLVCDE